MAKCDCCGKGVTFGIKVSHSHRRATVSYTHLDVYKRQSAIRSITVLRPRSSFVVVM